MDALYPSVCESAWNAHQNLVRSVVWKIVRKYGGDYDELFSEALVWFVQAVESYEPACGSLPNWIGFYVYKNLLEVSRTRIRRHYIAQTRTFSEYSPRLSWLRDDEKSVLSDSLTEDEDFLSELYRDLSNDAQTALRLLFDMDDTRYKNMSMFRLALRVALQGLDWTNDKINSCFAEIEEAVT